MNPNSLNNNGGTKESWQNFANEMEEQSPTDQRESKRLEQELTAIEEYEAAYDLLEGFLGIEGENDGQ